jgi:hypothetical protein
VLPRWECLFIGKLGFDEVGRLEIGLEEFGGADGETHVHGELAFCLGWRGIMQVADFIG